MGKNNLNTKDKLIIIGTIYSIISIIALVVAIITFCIWQNKTIVTICLIVVIACKFGQNHITGFMRGCKYQKFLDNKKEDKNGR